MTTAPLTITVLEGEEAEESLARFRGQDSCMGVAETIANTLKVDPVYREQHESQFVVASCEPLIISDDKKVMMEYEQGLSFEDRKRLMVVQTPQRRYALIRNPEIKWFSGRGKAMDYLRSFGPERHGMIDYFTSSAECY